MRETGYVVSVQKEMAKVQIQRHAACGDCGACQIGQEKMTMEALVENLISAKIGDRVEIETETVNILKASFIIYAFPLISFIVGTVLGYQIAISMGYDHPANFIAFGSGILFTILSYLVVKFNEKRFVKDKSYRPTILRVIQN